MAEMYENDIVPMIQEAIEDVDGTMDEDGNIGIDCIDENLRTKTETIYKTSMKITNYDENIAVFQFLHYESGSLVWRYNTNAMVTFNPFWNVSH